MYEVRKFRQINSQVSDKQFIEKQDSFTDIYFMQKDFVNIGIKFRQPKQKDYGWKLTKFQCKIAHEELSQEGYPLEKWSKFKFSFEEPIKLKRKQFQDEDQQKSQKKTLKVYNEISKILLNSQIKNEEIVLKWCQSCLNKNLNAQNFQFFQLKKNKSKTFGSQFGKIQVNRLFSKGDQRYIFETLCFQSKNPIPVSSKIFEWQQNKSYPSLLNKLMKQSQKSQNI